MALPSKITGWIVKWRCDSGVLGGVESRFEERPDLPRLGRQTLTLGLGGHGDGAGLGVRLLEDQVGLPLRVRLQLVGGFLRRDERRAQQRFEILVPAQLRLELLDPVGELGPLAPRLLERLLDLVQQPVDRAAAVAEQAPLEADVVELDWGDGHRFTSSQEIRRSC